MAAPLDAQALEEQKVAGAIRTDFILSAEIMAISLASIETPNLVAKAIILALVGIFITMLVYGVVAIIVKADDVGLYLAREGRSEAVRGLGRQLVGAMPPLLAALSFIGMLAMLWVGGGIVLHGLGDFGLGAIPHGIEHAAEVAGAALGPVKEVAAWLVQAGIAGVIGLALGWLVARVVRAVRDLL